MVAFGSAALFVEHVVDELRADGHRVGLFRPVTLWPFPGGDLAAATRNASRVLVFELNAGQMLDDVRQFAYDRGAVRFIGGVSIHASGLSFGPLLDVEPDPRAHSGGSCMTVPSKEENSRAWSLATARI